MESVSSKLAMENESFKACIKNKNFEEAFLIAHSEILNGIYDNSSYWRSYLESQEATLIPKYRQTDAN